MKNLTQISTPPASDDAQATALSIHALLDTAQKLVDNGELDMGIQSYMLAADRLNDCTDALSYLALVQHAERVMRESVLPALEVVNPGVFS